MRMAYRNLLLLFSCKTFSHMVHTSACSSIVILVDNLLHQYIVCFMIGVSLYRSESDITCRRVHRESNLMFKLSSDKDQRKNSLLLSLSVNEPNHKILMEDERESNCTQLYVETSI